MHSIHVRFYVDVHFDHRELIAGSAFEPGDETVLHNIKKQIMRQELVNPDRQLESGIQFAWITIPFSQNLFCEIHQHERCTRRSQEIQRL